MKTVKIRGNEYKMNFKSFRAHFEFEKMTGKEAVEAITVTDHIRYMYCILKGSNSETFEMSFDDFLNALDEDQDLFQNLQPEVGEEEVGEQKKIAGAQL